MTVYVVIHKIEEIWNDCDATSRITGVFGTYEAATEKANEREEYRGERGGKHYFPHKLDKCCDVEEWAVEGLDWP